MLHVLDMENAAAAVVAHLVYGVPSAVAVGVDLVHGTRAVDADRLIVADAFVQVARVAIGVHAVLSFVVAGVVLDVADPSLNRL